MARLTVDDCLEKVPNRFDVVLLATKRARQLEMTNEEPQIKHNNDKCTVIALREIAAGIDVNALVYASKNEEEDAI